MKNCISILIALLLLGCSGQQMKIAQRAQDSTYLAQYIHPATIKYMNDSLRLVVRDSIRSFGFDTIQYHSIEDIDKELAILFENRQYISWNDDWVQDLADNRLRYHLDNPLTFTEDMPIMDSLINIIVTPDKKYKFYSYWLGDGGTRSDHKTFFQYWDKTGKVGCQSWQGDLRLDCTRGILDIWQFNHAGQDYYVIKSYKRGQACSWYYYMEIVTIEDGEIVYHTGFYPNGIFEPHNAKHLLYDGNGIAIDECWKPAYDIMICFTDNCNTNIDYSFAPETLTIHVKDDADTTDSRTRAIKERSWKLVLPHTPYTKSNNPADSVWIKEFNSIELPIKNDSLINVYFKYDQIVNGYEVTGRWTTLDPYSETGHVIMNFRHTTSGQSFQYIGKKYTNFNIEEMTFINGYKSHKHRNEDVYYFKYVTPQQTAAYDKIYSYPYAYNNLPFGYYTPFQFYDVNFDGKKELIINTWDKLKGGNTYLAYRIDYNGIELLDYIPFNSLNNEVVFDTKTKQIRLHGFDGAFDDCFIVFSKRLTDIKCKDIPNDGLVGYTGGYYLEKYYRQDKTDFRLDSIYQYFNQDSVHIYATVNGKLTLVEKQNYPH